MTEAHNTPQQFNTQLPYAVTVDTATGNDSVYADYLYDSLNIRQPDSTFVFELKNISAYQEPDSTQQQIIYKPSFFFPYKIKPVIINPRVRNDDNFDWLTGLFLLCLIILVWVRYEGEKRISQLFRAVFARHNLNQLLRDGDVVTERITPALMFIYLISASTLLLTYLKPFKINFPGAGTPFLQFSIIAGGLFIFWLIKLIVIRVSGKVFRTRSESEEYLLTNLIYNIASGLLAFPFVFSGYYAENQISIYIATGVFLLGITLRFVRSIFVGLSAQTFPVIYLFLYLCTLEILPLLVLYKLISI